MKIELGNITGQRRHSVSSYSGSSDGVDTTSYVHTYSFDPASYDVRSTSFQDSDTTLICTVDDTGNMITITMTLDAERRFIRSLKVDEWHRSYYPEESLLATI
jgi:hypothetical protein